MQARRGLLPLSGHEVLVTDAGALYMGERIADHQRPWGALPAELLAAYDRSVDPPGAWVRPYGVVSGDSVVQAEVGAGRTEPRDGQWWRVAVLQVGPLWASEYDPSWTWLRLSVDGSRQSFYRPDRP